jgi:hypothetical protein
MIKVVNYKINLPLSFCEFAIRNNFFAPLRLYIYLKVTCRGQLFLGAKAKAEIAQSLNVEPRTVSNLLKKLQNRNWIGHNPASGYFFIRGFEKVRNIENMRGLRGILVDTNKDIQEQERFKALVVGGVIGHMANVGRYKRGREKQESEHIKVRSNHNSRNTVPSHFPVACTAIGAMLGIAPSTASIYKALAAKYGFIQVEKKWQRLQLAGDSKVRDAAFVASFKASHPEIAHRVRIIEGKAYLQETDHVMSCLSYAKKWRLGKKSKRA